MSYRSVYARPIVRTRTSVTKRPGERTAGFRSANSGTRMHVDKVRLPANFHLNLSPSLILIFSVSNSIREHLEANAWLSRIRRPTFPLPTTWHWPIRDKVKVNIIHLSIDTILETMIEGKHGYCQQYSHAAFLLACFDFEIESHKLSVNCC